MSLRERGKQLPAAFVAEVVECVNEEKHIPTARWPPTHSERVVPNFERRRTDRSEHPPPKWFPGLSRLGFAGEEPPRTSAASVRALAIAKPASRC